MAQFLTTTQISSQLELLIQEADKVLYLVSPFLKLSKAFEELINSRNKKEKKTIIIYGKYELTPEKLKFLTSLRYVYLKFHENLHAKCYINDSKLIITSMNFYEYSMIHNKEMGVLYDKADTQDLEIYSKALQHVRFIEENSNDKPFELTANNGKTGTSIAPERRSQSIPKTESQKPNNSRFGYCIRTGIEMPFNVDKPMTPEAFKSWSKFGNPDYEENFCHFSGEPSNHETSLRKPIMAKNWKKAKEIFNLK